MEFADREIRDVEFEVSGTLTIEHLADEDNLDEDELRNILEQALRHGYEVADDEPIPIQLDGVAIQGVTVQDD